MTPRRGVTLTSAQVTWGRSLVIAVGGVALLLVPVVFLPVVVQQLSLVLVFSVALLGLNLLVGYSGQVSLAHSVFFAVGAYTGAVLVGHEEVHYLIPMITAAALTFVLGWAVGLPALRLQRLYLAMVTFALALAVPPLIVRFETLTGGNRGIVIGSDNFSLPGIASDQTLYYTCLITAVLAFGVARNIVTGPMGPALAAVRVNEFAAAAHGVSPGRVKTLTFAWGSMYAGVAGCLFAYVTGFVGPDSFTFVLSISMLAAAVIGGVNSLAGALIGAVYIQYLPQVADKVNENLVGLVYGVVLVLVVLIAPTGVVGIMKRAVARYLHVQDDPPAHTPSAGRPPSRKLRRPAHPIRDRA